MNRLQPALILGLLCLGGCVGKNSVGFVTVDNFGVDISPSPEPTAGVSYGRTEVAIEPTFGKGNVPSLAAGVWHDTRGLAKFAQDGMAIFAGGNAADNVGGAQKVELPKNPTEKEIFEAGLAAVACVKEIPEALKSTGQAGTKAGDPLDTGVFAFGTRTGIGFRVTIPTTPATVPFARLHLGYNRVEAAVVPLIASEGGCVKKEGNKVIAGNENEQHAVHSPSFIGIIGTHAKSEVTDGKLTGAGFGFGVGQVLATGRAAEEITKHKLVHGSLARLGGQFIDNNVLSARAQLVTSVVVAFAEADKGKAVDDQRVTKIAKALKITKKDKNDKDVEDISLDGLKNKISAAGNIDELAEIEGAINKANKGS